MFRRLVAPLTLVLAPALLPGRLVADPAAATPAAVAAQARLRVAPGLEVDLWAAEPLVQDVTSLAFDGHGRAYVVESGRRRTSVFDVRNLQPWLDDDLALRSVEARDALLRRLLTPGEPSYDAFLQAVTRSKFNDFNGDGVTDWRDLQVEQERIRLVWDANADGRADTARTFAHAFNGLTSGVAAGVLTRGTNVWFTCIPDLWRLPAAPAPGSPSEPQPPGTDPQSPTSPFTPSHPDVERLLSGFGVHIAFGGHDLHGLQFGPDGRLYFSIADRGASIPTREGTVLSIPDTGAVFRCEPDGTQLEVFATGLRNPQELAFDDLGNLWTGDNNGDGGDKARWTLLIEGADYGWTIGWQWLPKMGAWNSERLWHTRESNSAAYLVPPVAYVGHGPAGIAHYPGTGLGDRFRDHFFYADFPGGIRAFRVEPDGAFFRVPDAGPWMEDNSAAMMSGKLLWNLAPVDVAFPPGGGVIVADAFPSWEKTGSARLWRVFDPALRNDPAIAEVARVLRQGMVARGEWELVDFLAHRDQRVRLEAQWEMAARGPSSIPALTKVALESRHRLARMHALWAVGQISRQPRFAGAMANPTPLDSLLADPDPFIQEAAIRLFGEAGMTQVAGEILRLSTHANPRVAAAALRVATRLHLGRNKAVAVTAASRGRPWEPEWLEQALTVGHFDDPVVREARVQALVSHSRDGNPSLLRTMETQADSRLQLLAVLARRRTPQDTDLLRHLHGAHPQLVLEAARALHDQPDFDSWKLLPDRLADSDFLAHPTSNSWPSSLNFTRDEWRAWVFRRVVNATFLLGSDATETHAAALARFATRTDVPESVRIEALDALADWSQPVRRDRVLGVHRPRTAGNKDHAREALAVVWPTLTDSTATPPLLLATLRAGSRLRPDGFTRTLHTLRNHAANAVRAEATRIAAQDQPMSVAQLAEHLDTGSLIEQREALARLSVTKDPDATEHLANWMRKLNDGKVAPELQLDVLEAATLAGGRRLESLVQAWTHALPKDDPLARHRVALHGGDAANGRRLFAERADWGCQRCHKLHGEGGDVGPDVTGIVLKRGGDYVLNSILHPNKDIAPGFENVLVTLVSGGSVAGMVKSETETELVIDTGEDGRVTLPKSDIASRQRGLSSMVEGLDELIPLRELRDLVAALGE